MKKKRKIWAIVMILLMMMNGLLGCTQSKTTKEEVFIPDYEVEEQAVTLTIEGKGKEAVTFTTEDFEQLGLETREYSGRNKEMDGKRQLCSYTGVDLDKLLEKAGFETEGARLYVICSDGYTREYTLEDLHGLYTYKDNETEDKTEVEPMIAIRDVEGEKYPSPFKLVSGQAGYDSSKTMDFNMQGWAEFIQYIYVSY